MKLSRILFLLLLTGVSLFSRPASAQVTITVQPACQSPNTWIINLKNGTPDFINHIRFFLPFADTSELSLDGNVGDPTNVFTSNDFGGDTLYYDGFNGGGLLTGSSDTALELELDSADFNSFPIHLYDSSITIEWEVLSGNNVVTSGSFTLTPTSYQSNCTFDSVSATSQTVGCDPQFNFHVFNKNGLRSAIGGIKFELLGSGAGEMRPDAMQAPPGWSVGTITQNSVTFTGGPLPFNNNLSGFIVDVSAPQNEKFFSFRWYAFDNTGSLIDRDSVSNIPATVPECSETPSSDSVSFSHQSDCSFIAHLANYHNGSRGDTVSPIVEYTFKINTPGVTWTQGVKPAPPQASLGTWEANGWDSQILIMDFVHGLRKKYPGFSQPSGTIWTPELGISGSSNNQPVSISWSDSNFDTLVASGTTTIACSNSTSDSAWVIDSANCNYSIVVSNQHSNPSGSLNVISIVIPNSAGSINTTANCVTTTNHWSVAQQLQSARFTNLNAAPGFLRSGSKDTIGFCFKSNADVPWVATIILSDSNGTGVDTVQVQIPACAPAPTVLNDSVIQMRNRADCEDTIGITNRSSTVNIDAITFVTDNSATISGVVPLSSFSWTKNLSANRTSDTLVGGAIEPLTTQYFLASFTTQSLAPFHVTVNTTGNITGGTLSNTWRSDTLSCAVNAVSETTPQIPLSVSIVPNPMTSEANITVTTGAFDRVQMVLLDVLGHTVQSVANGTISAGDHSYSLDVSQIPNGTYYLRIQTSSQTVTKALVVTH